ncbi:hypothetical protein IMSAG025_02513 [Muribaculaceae bacterium]|nr:hypothetical protein IMSAG025_02513 [Muribaculaceae bacterium]
MEMFSSFVAGGTDDVKTLRCLLLFSACLFLTTHGQFAFEIRIREITIYLDFLYF